MAQREIGAIAAFLLAACTVGFDEGLLFDGSPRDIARIDTAKDRGPDLPGPDGPAGPDGPTDLPVADDGSADSAAPDGQTSDGQPPDQPPPPDLPLPDVLPPDTGPPPDLGACPAACTSCAGGTCQLDCSAGCVCPAGWNVAITCGNQTCLGDIDCSKATDVTISCGPKASCTGGITCGSGTCTVSCDDNSCLGSIKCGPGYCSVTCDKSSCKGDLDCSASCGCTLSCLSGASCSAKQICPPLCMNQCAPNHNCNNC